MTDMLSPAEWQIEDLAQLAKLDNSANWSQMGVFKTSSALWNLETQLKDIENPSVLVITTASGKGPWMRDTHRCLDTKWQLLNLKSDGLYFILNGMQIKVGKRLAEEIPYPHIVLSHYHLFSRSSIGKFIECKECDGRGLSADFLSPCFVCEGKGKIPKKPAHCDPLIQRHWDLVILDEAHRIKNPDTGWSTNIKKIKATKKHIMTGSGFVNRPDEIWSLFNFLEPDLFTSYWRFREEFCQEDGYSGYRTVTGLKKHKIDDFRKLRRAYGPRRTKPECFPNLTAPLYEDISIELNTTQRTMYDQIKYELMMLDQKGEPLHSPNVLSQLQRMRQISVATPEVISDEYDAKHDRRVVRVKLVEPSTKLDALMDVIDGLQWDNEDKQQIVVFSNFVDPLALLQKRLTKAGVNWIRLLPTDNDTQRYKKWSEEFPKKNHQVFLSTIKLGGESISLTSADYVAFLDLDWTPAGNDQAIERVWRPGRDVSKGAPIVIRIFAEDTIDQRMLEMNEMKRDWFRAIFSSDTEYNAPTANGKRVEATNWAAML